MKNILLIPFLAVLLFGGFANAQTDMSKWSVGVFPSMLQYQNSDGSEFFKVKPSSFGVDLGLGYDLNSSLMVEGHFMGAGLDFEPNDTAGKTLDTEVFDFNAQMQYKFNNGYILKETARVSPFLFAGAGVIRSKEGTGAVIPLGGGINFRVDELFSVQWRTTYKLTTNDEYNFFQHMLGFVWHLGAPDSKMAEEKPKDSDGDGIADMFDKCPNVPGIEANNGCPEVDQETQEILGLALEGIQFETAKDVLKNESYPILDRVVEILQKHPEYNMSIEGHTDSQGDDASNLDLSKRRAKRAMDYLVSKGIEANRLTSEGYGETQPVGSNDTPEGRAKNRRVEFKIVF